MEEYDGSLSNVHYLKFPARQNKGANRQIDSSPDKIKSEFAKFSFQKDSSKNLASIDATVKAVKPAVPVHFYRPESVKKAASWFLNNFCGQVLYSVKSNPDPKTLQLLYDAGVKHFDVASLAEVKMVAELFPDAKMYFMHPIKSREAIYEAYFTYGIRDFSLDSSDELEKILKVTGNAADLGLHVRLSIPNGRAIINLSGKFGILPGDSVRLLRKCRTVAQRLGICFHVGSQCMEPTEYRRALNIVGEVLGKAKVKLDVLDVGGGFPSAYPGMTPPPLINYMDEIHDSIKALNLDPDCALWCEPGRALVAESGSLLVRVEGRKKNMLYINDGTYGGLFDAGFPKFIYPVRAVSTKNNRNWSRELIPFGFYGPTCDSLDAMQGPFYLPKNIAEGDYIEIGQLGAYSQSIRTDFNGFSEYLEFAVNDKPLVSIYEDEANAENSLSAEIM